MAISILNLHQTFSLRWFLCNAVTRHLTLNTKEPMMGGKTRSMLRLFFAVIGPFDGSVVVFGVCVLNGLRAKC